MIFRTKASARCQGQNTLEQRLACLADAGHQAITERLEEIEREWSAGRLTKATIGVVVVAGLLLAGLSMNPWWLILPTVGGLLLLQYLFTRSSWLGATPIMASFTGAQPMRWISQGPSVRSASTWISA